MQVQYIMGTNNDFFNCYGVTPSGEEEKFASIPIDSAEFILNFTTTPFLKLYSKIIIKKGDVFFKTIERK